MALTNFLIIGEIKARTTSLHSYLRQHADIFMPSLKEARFFAFDRSNNEHVQKAYESFPVTTLEEYGKLFESVAGECHRDGSGAMPILGCE